MENGKNELKDLLIETLMESGEFTDALESYNPLLARMANGIVVLENEDMLDAAAALDTSYVACFTESCRSILNIP